MDIGIEQALDRVIDAIPENGIGTGGIELDTTLKQLGKAAEAKSTGDALDSINRDLSELDLKKMEYAILNFTGSAFQLNGQTLTFSEIKSLCLNTADFVYALYSNRLYIPQYVSNTNIFFESSYISSDIPQMHRIGINSSNQVNQYSFELALKSTVDGIQAELVGVSALADSISEVVG